MNESSFMGVLITEVLMNGLISAAKKLEEYNSVLSAVQSGRLPLGMTGLSHIHKAHFAAALAADTGRPLLIITPDEAQASRLTLDMRAIGCAAQLYPARDFAFRSTESQSREYEHRRLGVLDKMLRGKADAVVCSAEAASQLTLPPEELRLRTLEVNSGDEFELDFLVNTLVRAGYSKSAQVDGVGQFAVRGGVLDFFAPGYEYPCRLELWGDEVDSIAFFDPETQRRTDNIQTVKISPANEILVPDTPDFIALLERFHSDIHGRGSVKARASVAKDIDRLKAGIRLASTDKYMPLLYDVASIFDYAEGYTLVVSESFSVRERFNAAEGLMNETVKAMFEEGELCPGLDRFSLRFPDLLRYYEQMGVIYMDNLPRGSFDTPVRELVGVNARQIPAWNGSVSVLEDDLRALSAMKERTCVIFAGTSKAADALCSDLEKDGFNALFMPEIPSELSAGRITVLPGSISAGFEYPLAKITVMSHAGRVSSAVRKKAAKKTANSFHSLDELHRGDYVVHVAHGIGVFEGINKLEAGGTIKDYIKIRYDKGDVLYVPVTQLDQVSKYIGPSGDDKPVRLNRLGGKDWQKTRSKVRSAVKDMAKELTELYSKRMQIQGHAFSPDIDMQNDFERRFEFDETADQLRCVDEIKGDMEKQYPMDRLLCGDVGFGKTEVALRGAFKCVADGKQCAILVPTTILAYQHYQTLLKRFEGFPVEARMLSRFCTKKETEETIKGLRRGSVDIVVGTHRLISKDVSFKDLGLIIIDEEQRFGVAQKEKLKELYPKVDVLTLTATPIPRTLNMALSGIRDMSILEEAPHDRSPVQTYVVEYNPEMLAQAMNAELRRGGQVYYLHNRVETIEKTAAGIKELLPEATVGIAHGKMSEDELSEVWRRLLEGEIDILVCTTIIETGVDVPNVNTLIIEDADRMGLAQLHQIRGRVGRSSRRASAYLTFRPGKELSEIATNRLDAIREYTEFGSGFKIAMRDLELRGAGNVLGAQQHGHMEAVGYEMYLQLLEQAISEEKGEVHKPPKKECLVDLPIDAHIPPSYIESVPQRLGIYRRIADIGGRADADDVIDELIDRFGDPPEPVLGLIRTSLLRAYSSQHNIYEISRKNDRLLLYIDDLDMQKISAVAAGFPGRVTVSASGKPHISVKIAAQDKLLDLLEKVLMLMNTANKKA